MAAFLLRPGHLQWLPNKAGFGGRELDEKGEERSPHIDFALYSHCQVALYHGPKQAICSGPQCLSIPYLSSSLHVDHIMFRLSVSGSTFYHIGNYNMIRSVEKIL